MSPFRILEWRDNDLPGGDVNWYQNTFHKAVDDLWERRKLQCLKPEYQVFDRPDASSFQAFLEDQCRLHRKDGQMLGLICHGTQEGLMSHTRAKKSEILSYAQFWSSVETGLGHSTYHHIAFGSCESMEDCARHAGLAPLGITTIIGYSGKPLGEHALKLLCGLCAMACESYDAVCLALEDGGASRSRLKENFDLIEEFLKTQSDSPNKRPGFLPQAADPEEGDILLLRRSWLPPEKLKLI